MVKTATLPNTETKSNSKWRNVVYGKGLVWRCYLDDIWRVAEKGLAVAYRA